MVTFLEVLDLWDSPQTLATDIRAKLSRVQKWRARKKIPPSAWERVLQAAERRGFDLNAETLIRINAQAARRPRRVREPQIQA